MALPSVVPAPASIEADGSAPFALTSGTPIVAAAEIADATEALQSLIETRTGLRLDTREPADSAADARAIVLEIAGDGAAESYRLDVTEASVIVSGTDAAGLFYGVQTLGQLVEPAPGGWQIPAVRIVDAPRFAYRGVMLDVARHFHDVATVKAYIDRTSALKFTHLHLHLTDDQGWRLGTSAEDYDCFIGRVSRLAASLGKTPVAWHEAGTATDLEPTTVGQFWGYVEPIDGMDAKARGFTAVGSDQGKLILSPADAIYLDMTFDADSPLGLTWARGVTTARRAYEWDPAEVVDGVADEQILGVEAPLWTSQGIGFTPLDGIPWAVEVAAGADRGDA